MCSLLCPRHFFSKTNASTNTWIYFLVSWLYLKYFFFSDIFSTCILHPIYDQTQDYLQRNELLYSYQSGFWANHSTDTCLSQLTDMILNVAENGKHTGVILIDLQKAFGTLDHKILWSKMKCDRFFRWNNKIVSLLSHK